MNEAYNKNEVSQRCSSESACAKEGTVACNKSFMRDGCNGALYCQTHYILHTCNPYLNADIASDY